MLASYTEDGPQVHGRYRGDIGEIEGDARLVHRGRAAGTPALTLTPTLTLTLTPTLILTLTLPLPLTPTLTLLTRTRTLDQLYSIDTSGVSARFFATAMGKVSPRPALQMEATPHPHTRHRPTHPYPHTLVLDRDGQCDPRPYWPNLAHTSRSALSVAP